MTCRGFKGGIGTASRVVDGDFVVGVLVQAKYGRRERRAIYGVPAGERIPATEVTLPHPAPMATPDGSGAFDRQRGTPAGTAFVQGVGSD